MHYYVLQISRGLRGLNGMMGCLPNVGHVAEATNDKNKGEKKWVFSRTQNGSIQSKYTFKFLSKVDSGQLYTWTYNPDMFAQ